MHPYARFLVMIAASVVGMAALGALAVLVAMPSTFREMYFALAAGIIIASTLGIASMPFTIYFLDNTELRKSLPAVYFIAAVPTALWSFLATPEYAITTALPAFLAVIIAARICRPMFPLPLPAVPNPCPRCRYNLDNLREPGCPECGWGREG